MKTGAVIVLVDIRSVHNVASVFRTADCAGVSKVYLCGYTPAPLDRFGRGRKDFANVSLGAEKSVAWEASESATGLIRKLKKEGFSVVAVEQDPNATDYRKVRPKRPAAFVLGNEVGGLPKAVLRQCDVIAEIPMRGKKESLNVSVAAGIAVFRMLGL